MWKLKFSFHIGGFKMANYKIRGKVDSIILEDSKSYLRIGIDSVKVEKVGSNTYYLKLFDPITFNVQVVRVGKDEDRNIYYIDLELGSGLETSAVLGQEIEIKFDQIGNDSIIHNTSIQSISIGGYGSGGGNSSRRWSSEEMIDSLAPQREEQHTELTPSSRKFLQEETDSLRPQKEKQPGEPKMRIIRRK
jgi:hypothetical protein